MLHRQLRPWRHFVFIQSPPRPRAFARYIQQREYHPLQASILFQTPNQPTPESLIASIVPPKQTIDDKPAPTGQAVLLFTPSFAQSLAYNPKFLADIVNRLYHDVQKHPKFDPAEKIRIAVAVVDRLPYPSKGQSSKYRALHPPAGDCGHEGMSYIISAANILNITPTTEIIRTPTHDQLQTITLKIGRPDCGKRNYEIQVPLASTIFQAGKPHVLSLTQWEWTVESPAGDTMLRLIDTSSPSDLSFTWPMPSLRKIEASLSVPLQPLTSARKITAGMGNVIREIEGRDKSIPASHELESSVNSYFAAKDLPPSSVSAWALVLPADFHGHTDVSQSTDFLPMTLNQELTPSTEQLQNLWQSDPLRLSKYWLFRLLHGARLHRVLSGGGGWGKKAGLISLDPESEYKTAPTSDLSARFAASDLFEAQEGMLGSAAKVGDFVQFYIAPVLKDHPPGPSDWEVSEKWPLEIGTIPSTIDVMSLPTTEVDPTQITQKALTVPGFIGLLSEKGIAVRSVSNHEEGGEQIEQESQTKLTVPYTRWSFRSSSLEGPPPAKSLSKTTIDKSGAGGVQAGGLDLEETLATSSKEDPPSSRKRRHRRFETAPELALRSAINKDPRPPSSIRTSSIPDRSALPNNHKISIDGKVMDETNMVNGDPTPHHSTIQKRGYEAALVNDPTGPLSVKKHGYMKVVPKKNPFEGSSGSLKTGKPGLAVDRTSASESGLNHTRLRNIDAAGPTGTFRILKHNVIEKGGLPVAYGLLTKLVKQQSNLETRKELEEAIGSLEQSLDLSRTGIMQKQSIWAGRARLLLNRLKGFRAKLSPESGPTIRKFTALSTGPDLPIRKWAVANVEVDSLEYLKAELAKRPDTSLERAQLQHRIGTLKRRELRINQIGHARISRKFATPLRIRKRYSDVNSQPVKQNDASILGWNMLQNRRSRGREGVKKRKIMLTEQEKREMRMVDDGKLSMDTRRSESDVPILVRTVHKSRNEGFPSEGGSGSTKWISKNHPSNHKDGDKRAEAALEWQPAGSSHGVRLKKSIFRLVTAADRVENISDGRLSKDEEASKLLDSVKDLLKGF